jgi:Fe-S cluster assembly protein SufD
MTTSLAERQVEAAASFAAQGWPTRALEAWKTTPVKPITAFGDGSLLAPTPMLIEGAREALASLAEAAGPRLVLVGGHLISELSELGGLKPSPVSSDEALGAIAALDGAPLVALSGRALGDALVIRATEADGDTVEVVHVGVPGTAGSHVRLLIDVERSGELTVVEHFVSVGGDPSWTNSVTEVAVGPNASVCHVQILRGGAGASRTGNVTARVDRDGRFHSHVISMGAQIGRSEIQVKLAGQGSSCDLSGLYVAVGDSVLDNYTEVEHLAPHTSSDEVYRGVMADRATGGFVGRVLIHEGAIKSETHQLNNNLLLSPQAVVHSRPQLEIDNDDVAATHGSTVGQLDRAALFYLRSRGLRDAQAKALMTWAFVKAQIDRLPTEALRDLCCREVAERLEVDSAWIGELD